MTLTDFLHSTEENVNVVSPIIEGMAETLSQSWATQPSHSLVSGVSAIDSYSDRVRELRNRIEILEERLYALENRVLENDEGNTLTQTDFSARLDIIEHQLRLINDPD